LDTPGVTATATATATTCNAICDGTATVTAASGTPPYTYLWNNGQTTPSISSLCAGTYTVIVTDSTLCTYSVTATVTQPTPVTVEPVATPPSICIGQSSTLNAVAIGGTPGYTFNWLAPAFTGNPYIVSPSVTTTYTVSATDANGCASVNQPTVTVTVRPPLSVVASPDVDICVGDNATISAIGNGGDGTYNYDWMPGSLSGATQVVSPASTTVYTITLSDTVQV
jgi:trimeric autotransporter adhesin